MSLLNKAKQRKEKSDPLIKLMMQLMAGMLACVFCLVSMTWAWFSASVDTQMQTIKSATRSTEVIVYKLGNTDPKERTPVIPQTTQIISLAETQTTPETEATVEVSGRAVSWDLEPEKSYEIVMTGSGDATKGYCEVALTHTKSGETTPTTTTYKTVAFENNHTVKFTYKTGGFESVDGVTNTQWTEYVENTTTPTLTISSYWGQPAEENEPQVALMSLRGTAEEEIMLLDDGAVLGLDPIPCPEAKAESKVELEGFEIQEGAVISAEEDYKVSLTLKEGYEMPNEVVVNINGKDYVVSTEGAESNNDSPYYDAHTNVLTVPSSLLSDGVKVSVKATATQTPVEEEETEEATEESIEEETEETTDSNETEKDNSADTSSDNDIVADNPSKKEEDKEQDNDEPVRKPIVGGGNDDDDDMVEDDASVDSSTGDSSSDDNEEETVEEKADLTLDLSQLIINLEETKIPTNADLVLTLSAIEDMELPERIVITLDKTIYDESIDDEEFNEEEIIEDKTEYVINTDGNENPEGFEFDTESGELTISSELLEGVREIIVADTQETEIEEDEDKATITFEVKNITFNFADDEIATDEDVVINFAAGEGYELPETITITIDDEEYIIYTSVEDSDKNRDGITFDIETGTLTISKDLLEDVKAITIIAEGIEKEEEESKDKDESPDADKKDESEDKDTIDKENESESGEATDKETEGEIDAPATEDKTETDDRTETEGGTNDETTTPETNLDNTTEGEDNNDNNCEDNGEDKDEAEISKPDTEPATDTESGNNGEITTTDSITPAEPTTTTEPDEPVVTPETPKTEMPNTSESETSVDDNDETGNDDVSLMESSANSENESTDSNMPSDSAVSSLPNVTLTVPTTSAGSKETDFEE